jgi:transcriptional regulator with XRE-family HTH domain
MERQMPDLSAAHALGLYLRELRTKNGASLREVEDAIDVSNAYLSQLENGKIAKPSPHILHSLATFYRVPYEALMERAGYVKKKSEQANPVLQSGRQAGKQSGRLPASSFEGISQEEELQLLEYLNFIRSQANKRHGKKT